jgi:penicillin-binding protein 1B
VEVGLDQVIETARKLGITSELPRVPSLSLGVAELSPVELLRAYATLANQGEQDTLTVIRGILTQEGDPYATFQWKPESRIPRAQALLLTDTLKSVFTEGSAKSSIRMGWDRSSAGKTGTTSQYRDAWFAGYTPELTTVVWVGLDETRFEESTKLPKLTGAGSALPIWIQFMKGAHESIPPSEFPEDEGIEEGRVDLKSGASATPDCPIDQVISEKYLKAYPLAAPRCELQLPPIESETDQPEL